MLAPASDSAFTSSAQMPMYRSAFHQHSRQVHHQPKCRCSDCHLKVDLFPRNERGTILLPHPSWIHPLGPTNDALKLEDKRWGVPVPQSKGKEVARSSSRNSTASYHEGPGQSRPSSGWQHHPAGEQSRMASPNNPSTSTLSPTTSANTNLQHSRPSFSVKLPEIVIPPASPRRPLSPMQPLPHLSELHAPSSTTSHKAQASQARSSLKRKASVLQGSSNHVAHSGYPVPQSFGNADAQRSDPARPTKRRTLQEDPRAQNSPKGTPETRGLPYLSPVPGGQYPRSHPGPETDLHNGYGTAYHGSNPHSARASPTVLPPAPGPSNAREGTGLLVSAQPPPHGGVAPNSEPSLIRFSVKPENFQLEGMMTTSRVAPQSRGRSAETSIADDTSSAQADDDQDERGSGSDSSDPQQFGSQGSSTSKRRRGNAIRFREPLTSESRQNRQVVKGGVSIVQVKWDSDRKRRQGYFAPDSGAEKSPFRHYSKDDCCFDA